MLLRLWREWVYHVWVHAHDIMPSIPVSVFITWAERRCNAELCECSPEQCCRLLCWLCTFPWHDFLHASIAWLPLMCIQTQGADHKLASHLTLSDLIIALPETQRLASRLPTALACEAHGLMRLPSLVEA